MTRRWKLVLPLVGMLLMGAGQAQASLIYVGSWDFTTLGGLSNGQYNASNPYWWELNPPVYNALEAAAVIFGGNPSDYAISTIDSNPANVNHKAFVDGWGDWQYLVTPVAETYKLDTGNPGYNDPVGGPAYSALVFDHGPGFPNAVNYAFKVVPEPSLLLLGAIGGLGLLRRRFRA